MTETPRYLCHECGNPIAKQARGVYYWCFKCRCRRKKPTHPALIIGG